MGWKRWQIIAGIVLMVGATTASALSLGRMRGTALVGRGLDLSVQGVLDAQESTPEASCFSVDLFYGDTRVSPNLISLSPERTASGELRVRIRSSLIVDEPVVTLFVRASCGASVSRKYVLLSETLSDTEQGVAQIAPLSPPVLPRAVAPRVAADTAAGTSAGVSAGVSVATSNSAPSNASAERAALRQERREARQRQAEERKQARQVPASLPDAVDKQAMSPRISAASRKNDKTKTTGPRLQVDLLDLTSADLNLRGSAELISAPANDQAVRNQAQALWRMLNATPEEALRDTQRLETLESQMRTALEQSKRQGQDIATLNTELLAAQRARYVNPFTIFLGLLALGAIGMSLWLWRRNPGDTAPWWGSSTKSKRAGQDEEHLWDHLDDEPASSAGSSTSAFKAPASGSPASLQTTSAQDRVGVSSRSSEGDSKSPLRFVEKPGPVEFAPPSQKLSLSTAKIQPIGTSAGHGRGGSMGRVDSTPPPSLIHPSAAQSGRSSGPSSRSFGNSDFAPSSFVVSRVIAAEELFDIQEQADFFMSLDQPDQAIEVLKNHITENVETSALAYMDLFDIYHRTGREKDYVDLREEFNRVFNAQVPEFAQFGARSEGLEAFSAVLKNIQSAWNSSEALDVIEESIFRHPEEGHQVLDMQAYRELMMLYALAKELARPGSGYSLLPTDTQAPLIAPISTGQPDLSLDDPLSFSGPQGDMLSFDDPTVSLPPISTLDAEGGLDFDLSDSADSNSLKPFVVVKKP